MASFFLWLIVIVGGLIVGAFAGFFLFFLITFLKDLFVKKGIPSNRQRVSEYLKDEENMEKYKNPGLPTQSEKEVYKTNEQRRVQKFREFERLRREEFKGRTRKSPKNNSSSTGSQQLQQQPKLLPNGSSGKRESNSPRDPSPKLRVKLDG